MIWVVLAELVACTPAGAAQGGGYTLGGLVGQYFATPGLVGIPGFTRRDVRLDFGLNSLPPGGAGLVGDHAFRTVPGNAFSVRWTGQLIPRFSETYQFKAVAREKFKLRLRPIGAPGWSTVIDQSAFTDAPSIGSLALIAGEPVDLEIELVHEAGAWAAQLRWASPSTPDEVIDPLVDSGINNPDWTSGFTDLVKGAARNSWQRLDSAGGVNWGAEQAVDALGWPMGDGAYVFQESLNQGLDVDPLMRGRVGFFFRGSASVSIEGNVAAGSLVSGYDASQNLTRGSFVVTNRGSNVGVFKFKNARRDGKAGGPPGITELRLMRPLKPDDLTYYDSTNSLFTPQLLESLTHFTLVRHMYVANQQRDWSERTRPEYFNQNAGAKSPPHYEVGEASNNGLSWEHKILLANQTGRDLMLSIPTVASGRSPGDAGSYIAKLAKLIRNGSDGVEPYEGFVDDPVYPPLNPNLRVYLELGNELWNTGYPWFVDWMNINRLAAADAGAENADFRAMNFDGLSTARDGGGSYVSMNSWRHRKIALRLVQISDIFRATFGDAAMMSRIRPVYEWQYGNYGDTARQVLTFLDLYFNNADGLQHVVDPQPVRHWLWGGGGATYYGAFNGNGLTSLISNPSFGSPALERDGYRVSPEGADWSFSGTAGIARHGPSTSDIPPPFQGQQMAFITDRGSLSVRVTFPTNFTSPVYGVSFKAANRLRAGASVRDGQSVRVFLDETTDITARTFSQYDGYNPDAYDPNYRSRYPGYAWAANNVPWHASEYYFTRSFSVQPGSTHVITFRGLGNRANPSLRDQTLFLGEVRISSVDRIFGDGMPGGGDASGQPEGFLQEVMNVEATWAKAFGLEEVSYEGGWSLGGDDGGSWVQSAAKYGDARAAKVQSRFMDLFRLAGSSVNVLGTFPQWPSWADYYAEQGLLDVSQSPIIKGVDLHASQLPVEADNGLLLPASLIPVDASISDLADIARGRVEAPGGWMNWNVIAPFAGPFDVDLVLSVGNAGTGMVLVDDVPWSGSGKPPAVRWWTKGLHSIKVRSTSAAPLLIERLIVSSRGGPARPTLLPPGGGDGHARLAWTAVEGATRYEVRYGQRPGRYTTVVEVGGELSATIRGLTNGVGTYFAVVAGNSSGLSLPSAEQGVIPLAVGQTGSLAIWDFQGFGGGELSASPRAESGQVGVDVLRRGAGLEEAHNDFALRFFSANRFASEPASGVGHVYGATLEQSLAMNQFYEIRLQARPGQAFSVAGLEFRGFFQNDVGGAGMVYSVDGSPFGPTLLAEGSPRDSKTPWHMVLSGESALQNCTSARTIRIVLFGLCPYCVSGLGDSSGEDLIVTGNVVPVVPVVLKAPVSQSIDVGGTVKFSALGMASAPVSYQWKFNGQPVEGGRGEVLTLEHVGLAQAGNYSVIVANDAGSVESGMATLSVNKRNQFISFPEPAPSIYGTAPFMPVAASSSGLPVSFVVLSGPAESTAQGLRVTGAGLIRVRAIQPGDETYLDAPGVERTFPVAKARLTITVLDAGREYGVANPKFEFSISGFVNGDSASVVEGSPILACAALPASAPGPYPITASEGTLRPSSPNYLVSFTEGRLTVNKARQTLIQEPVAGMTYGHPPFQLRAKSTSGLEPRFSIVSGPASVIGGVVTITGAGRVAIRVSQDGDSNFLPASEIAQTFEVLPAVLEVVPRNANRPYGRANPSFTLAYSGFVNGEGEGILTGTVGLSTTATVGSPPGSYAITASKGTLDSGNYAFNFGTGLLTVVKADQSITFASIGNRRIKDSPFLLEASADSDLPVVFNVSAGPAKVEGNLLTLAGTGMVTVRASQGGNDYFNAASDMNSTFLVSQGVGIDTPRPAFSNFLVQGPSIVVLEWTNAVVGMKYRVQYKPSLTSPSWLALAEVGAVSETASFTDTSGKGGERYYRLEIVE